MLWKFTRCWCFFILEAICFQERKFMLTFLFQDFSCPLNNIESWVNLFVISWNDMCGLRDCWLPVNIKHPLLLLLGNRILTWIEVVAPLQSLVWRAAAWMNSHALKYLCLHHPLPATLWCEHRCCGSLGPLDKLPLCTAWFRTPEELPSSIFKAPSGAPEWWPREWKSLHTRLLEERTFSVSKQA